MAGADYHHCEVCGAKTFYDSNVLYEESLAGEVLSLCRKCIKTKALRVVDRDPQVDSYSWWIQDLINAGKDPEDYF